MGSADGGVLHISGRADDVITTGGLKVGPREVEEALLADPRVAEACVVAVPDDEWGQAVAAALVLREPVADPLALARSVTLPRHALPRRVVVVAEMPQRGPGKPDRAAVVELLSDLSERA